MYNNTVLFVNRSFSRQTRDIDFLATTVDLAAECLKFRSLVWLQFGSEHKKIDADG